MLTDLPWLLIGIYSYATHVELQMWIQGLLSCEHSICVILPVATLKPQKNQRKAKICWNVKGKKSQPWGHLQECELYTAPCQTGALGVRTTNVQFLTVRTSGHDLWQSCICVCMYQPAQCFTQKSRLTTAERGHPLRHKE